MVTGSTRAYVHPASFSPVVTASTTTGVSPVLVHFTGAGSGGTPPYAYLWDFGDGSPNTTIANPSHTYFATESGAVQCGSTFPPPANSTAESCFPATLTLTDAHGYTATKSIYILVVPFGLSGTISANTTAGPSPLIVGFTSGAMGGKGPYSFLWDFGDGSANSTSPTVTHSYSNGSYRATLLVRDANGDTNSTNVSINATGGAPGLTSTANASNSTGSPSQFVYLNSTAQGCPTTPSFRWDFGDGGTAVGQDTTHTYREAGDFPASVIVSCPGFRFAVATANTSIKWYGLDWGEYAISTYGYAPLNASFGATAYSSNMPLSFTWDFGDGSPASHIWDPTHVFRIVGDFPVTLTVSDAFGRNASGSIGVQVWRPTAYAVNFSQSGLPDGQRWLVNLTGDLTGDQNLSSSGRVLDANLTNGTYNFSVYSVDQIYRATNGTFTVNGTGASVNITFYKVVYKATFNETGLPSGDEWWVNITGEQPENSTRLPISPLLTNGSYNYSVSTDDKRWSAQGGSFEVTGRPQSLNISFNPVYYGVTLVERGLPSNTTWSVRFSANSGLGGFQTNESSFSFGITNGTFDFSVARLTGFTAAPANGSFQVEGTNVTIAIQFARNEAVVGIPQFDQYVIVGSIAAVAIAAVAAALFGRRKAGPN